MLTTLISPVAVYPGEANTLAIRSITLGPPPSYYYELQQVTQVEKTREVPNPDYVAPSVDGGTSEDVTPPSSEPQESPGGSAIDTTSPTITETYTETIVTVLKNGNVSMTEEQWQDWGDQVDDDEYQLAAIAHNLGLTIAE